MGSECQCGCEIEVIVKMKKEVGMGGGGQGGCEHEKLNYCDNAKKLGGGVGVTVHMTKESKLLRKC